MPLRIKTRMTTLMRSMVTMMSDANAAEIGSQLLTSLQFYGNVINSEPT